MLVDIVNADKSHQKLLFAIIKSDCIILELTIYLDK